MKILFVNKARNLIGYSYDETIRAVKILYRDLKTRTLTATALLINIFIWSSSIFVNLRNTKDVIILHHNIYFGPTFIGSARQVYFIPLLGIIIILINLIVSYIIQHENNFFVYLFAAGSIAINFFLFLGMGSIIMINFR